MSATELNRTSDALWFRVLDKFGFPVLVALVLLVTTLRGQDADRVERTAVLVKLTAAIEHQTEVLNGLALEERRHADAVTATWPAIRLPPRSP